MLILKFFLDSWVIPCGGGPQNGEGSKKMDIMYSSSWLQGQAQGRKPKDAV